MPYDHRGQIVEAVDCVQCNSTLEWHGRLPEDPNDIVCNDCNADRLTTRAEEARAEVERLRGVLRQIVYGSGWPRVLAEDALRPTAARKGDGDGG